MAFVDRLFRQGHLSDDVLAGAIVTGDRPAHLDHCAMCATKALEISRWLDDVRTDATAAADAAFPAERLAIQHTQILRRIEQVEEPVRVLEFPNAPVLVRGASSVRRVSAGWIGVAAAAGLALGIIGGHMSARIQNTVATSAPAPAATQAAAQAATPASDIPADGPGLFDLDLDGVAPSTLGFMEDNTARLIPTAFSSAR